MGGGAGWSKAIGTWLLSAVVRCPERRNAELCRLPLKGGGGAWGGGGMGKGGLGAQFQMSPLCTLVACAAAMLLRWTDRAVMKCRASFFDRVSS